jgi:hypothetical protein
VIRITIGKKRYKGVYRWDDITLKQFCDLAAIPMPQAYEAYILADGKFDVENLDQYIAAVSKITEKELSEDFPAYYRKVIAYLTNIPIKVISELDNEKVCDLYEYYFKPFVVSLLYHSPVIHFMGQLINYEPPAKEFFRVKWRTYYFPRSVMIDGQFIPLAGEPIITYAEACDQFRGMKVSREDVKRLAIFMAIYCRRLGERYDEENVLKRQELFMCVPMSIVWGVFFYTLRRMPGSELTTRFFGNLPRQIPEIVQAVKTYKSMEIVA